MIRPTHYKAGFSIPVSYLFGFGFGTPHTTPHAHTRHHIQRSVQHYTNPQATPPQYVLINQFASRKKQINPLNSTSALNPPNTHGCGWSPLLTRYNSTAAIRTNKHPKYCTHQPITNQPTHKHKPRINHCTTLHHMTHDSTTIQYTQYIRQRRSC